MPIELHLYLTFALATVGLMLIPGPNVALIVANSVAFGTRFGLLTVAGTCTASLIQLGLTGVGLAAVLAAMGASFEVLRWIGVAYLLFLGVRQWRAAAADLTRVRPQPKSPREIFGRGMLVSLTNPKTLLFYGAFFPQFISDNGHMTSQIVLLTATYTVIAAAVDSLWAALAGRLRGLLAAHGRLRNRLSGGLMIGAGVGLALVRRR